MSGVGGASTPADLGSSRLGSAKTASQQAGTERHIQMSGDANMQVVNAFGTRCNNRRASYTGGLAFREVSNVGRDFFN